VSIEEPITCVAVKGIKRFRLLRVSVLRVSDEMVSVREASDNLSGYLLFDWWRIEPRLGSSFNHQWVRRMFDFPSPENQRAYHNKLILFPIGPLSQS
jgi:hypothetical protein